MKQGKFECETLSGKRINKVFLPPFFFPCLSLNCLTCNKLSRTVSKLVCHLGQAVDYFVISIYFSGMGCSLR